MTSSQPASATAAAADIEERNDIEQAQTAPVSDVKGGKELEILQRLEEEHTFNCNYHSEEFARSEKYVSYFSAPPPKPRYAKTDWFEVNAACKCALLSAIMYNNKAETEIPVTFGFDQNGIDTYSTICLRVLLFQDYSSVPFSSGICWAVVQDPDTSAVYVAFRGSKPTRDWILNSSIFPDSGLHNNGKKSRLHGGYERAINADIVEITDCIESISTHPVSLTITGHSLGGGLAQILFSKIKSRYEEVTVTRCITFAAPLVNFEKNPLENCINFVNERDVIPHTPRVMRNKDYHKFVSTGNFLTNIGAGVFYAIAGSGDRFSGDDMLILDENYPLSETNIYFKNNDRYRGRFTDGSVKKTVDEVIEFIGNVNRARGYPFDLSAHMVNGYIDFTEENGYVADTA